MFSEKFKRKAVKWLYWLMVFCLISNLWSMWKNLNENDWWFMVDFLFAAIAAEAIREIREDLERYRRSEPEALDPIEGDLLPPIGEKVLIHLASRDEWVEHEVIGYYVWGDHGGGRYLHRVFVRVRNSEGVQNARLLSEVIWHKTKPHVNPDGRTGWPPGLLQDDSRGLSRWFASKVDARRRVREAVASIKNSLTNEGKPHEA